MHTTHIDTVVSAVPNRGRSAAASRAKPLETRGPGAGFGLALSDGMLRTIAFALCCVSFAAPSTALAKKKHPAPQAKKSAKRPKALALKSPHGKLARVDKSLPPTRVAAVSAVEPTSMPTPAAAPATAPAATSMPSQAPHVLGPQSGDDEVPGSRMKR
jgi:hypothetical protein